jgi:hypothetical protein
MAFQSYVSLLYLYITVMTQLDQVNSNPSRRPESPLTGVNRRHPLRSPPFPPTQPALTPAPPENKAHQTSLQTPLTIHLNPQNLSHPPNPILPIPTITNDLDGFVNVFVGQGLAVLGEGVFLGAAGVGSTGQGGNGELRSGEENEHNIRSAWVNWAEGIKDLKRNDDWG